MLNSAPVQLLPIDNGSGYKKTVSESVNNAEGKERFKEVLETAMKDDKSEERDIGISRKKESGKVKEKTKTEKSREKKNKVSEKKTGSETETAAMAAGMHESKVKIAAAKLKSGLRMSDEKVNAGAGKKIKQFNAVKIAVAGAKKEAARGSLKTASETGGAAVINLKDRVLKNSSEVKTAGSAELKLDRLAGKLSEAAENAIKTVEDVSPKVKPAIQLVSIATGSQKVVKDSIAVGKGEKGQVKSGSKLSVVDHRRSASVAADKGLKTKLAGEAQGLKPAVESVSREFEMSTASESVKSDVRTAETKTVQSTVLSQLKESVNGEIVKQAGMIIKGNGTGEIKLVMKPESLGKVRILLSLNDNHIAGRIIVENNIVREIFESNLENLYKAFGSQGFENGGLEVSVQGQGGNEDGSGHKKSKGFNGRAVKTMDEAVPEMVDSEWRNNAVNMVV